MENFEFISREEKLDSEQTRRSLTYWQDVWRRLKKNKLSMAGLIGVIVIVFFGVFGPLFTPYKYSDQILDYSNLPPRFEIYEIEEDKHLLVTKEYRLLETEEDGSLMGRIDSIHKDAINKIYYYQQEFVLDTAITSNTTYPNTFFPDGAFYSETWGIALQDMENIGGDDVLEIVYIHPNSPLKGMLVEGEEFVELGYTFTNAVFGDLTETEGFTAEDVIAELDAQDTINEFGFGGATISVNFSYKLQDPEDRPAGYEDALVTVTYKGVEQLDQIKSVANQDYLFGTDGLGRDLLTRVMWGARISLLVALIATLVNFFIGIFYGSISGYVGGWVDNLMMRLVDIINSIPLVLYVILLMVVLRDMNVVINGTIVFRGGSGLPTIIIALGSVYWVGMARLVRGQILGLKEQEYVLAARTIGVSNWKIITRHLVPNALGPIIVSMTMMIPAAVFTEAFLSFIGLGVSAPQASWGTLANDALSALTIYPYQLFFPAGAIAITMLAFNFLGDGLRDALDPRLRKG